MSAEALGDAVLDLVPRGVVPVVHEGVVPGSNPAVPWVVAVLTLPDVDARGMARRPQSFEVRLVLKAAAGNQRGVLRIFDDLLQIEGRRPVVDGWNCAPLEVFNVRMFDADRDVTLPGAVQPPAWGLLEVRCTASRVPGEESP